jgi:alpha-beta hydrolase superfamily lysophospholipase
MAPREARGTLSGARRVRLVYASWQPKAAPSAAVVIAHGYCEHMGRYAHVVQALVDEGWSVYAVDHRGHGQSEGPRANVERFDYFVDDLHLLFRRARDEQPVLPTFLIGHSMGGLIATHYALRHQESLAGLVLSGAALQIGERTSPLLKLIAPLIARLLPALPVERTASGGESVLSTDPAVQQRFDADPLCYTGPPLARMGYELLRASRAAQRQMQRLTLPLLIMHGADDRFVSPFGSQRLYQVARSADKTLKLWPNCRHEIFNERDSPAIIAFTTAWIAARVTG